MSGETTRRAVARTFFLNERQEVTVEERTGFGQPKPVDVDWSERSGSLVSSFRAAVSASRGVVDPAVAKAGHLFLLANPVPTVRRQSTRRRAVDGHVEDHPEFGGRHSLDLKKLGLDLLAVTADGEAVVHVAKENQQKLEAKLSTLAAGPPLREQARWARLDSFSAIPPHRKVSKSWLSSVSEDARVESVVQFFSGLQHIEIEEVLRSLHSFLLGLGGKLVTYGRRYSGGYWCRAEMPGTALLRTVEAFPSIQYLHERHEVTTFGWGTSSGMRRIPPIRGTAPIDSLPIVAVVDTGVPFQHRELDAYRAGNYTLPNRQMPAWTDHGSMVASCIVFGGSDPLAPGSADSSTCRFYNVDVGRTADQVHDDRLEEAMTAVRGSEPAIRVFNLSFGSRRPYAQLNDVEQLQHLLRLQQLDMFAFGNDALLVIAAGNSSPGVVPPERYPGHLDQPAWGLGVEALSYNGLVCGGFVGTAVPDGVAGRTGAPSPFSRIGPGLNGVPAPGFSAVGGDVGADYRPLAGASVWVTNAGADWVENVGTSFAAPLLAREVAWTVELLKQRCPPGVEPFAATVKAWMHFVAAHRAQFRGRLAKLASRTLGAGWATHNRLRSPDPESAVFVYQTMLGMPNQVQPLLVPVPLHWLREAKHPRLRLVCAWLTPVNSALKRLWGVRKVSIQARPFGGLAPLPGRSKRFGTYPLIDRTYRLDLDALEEKGFVVSEALWRFDIHYEVMGADPPALTVEAWQRVGIVMELYDDSEVPVSPQSAVQEHKLATELDRLGVTQVPVSPQLNVRI